MIPGDGITAVDEASLLVDETDEKSPGWLCRCYLTHPEERGLLASPAALERVAAVG